MPDQGGTISHEDAVANDDVQPRGAAEVRGIGLIAPKNWRIS